MSFKFYNYPDLELKILLSAPAWRGISISILGPLLSQLLDLPWQSYFFSTAVHQLEPPSGVPEDIDWVMVVSAAAERELEGLQSLEETRV